MSKCIICVWEADDVDQCVLSKLPKHIPKHKGVIEYLEDVVGSVSCESLRTYEVEDFLMELNGNGFNSNDVAYAFYVDDDYE